ncbi:MAG TPA: serine hydrolase [Segetibacter sp.]
MNKIILVLLFALNICFALQMEAQPKTNEWLVKLLSANKNEVLQQVLSNPGTYRYQIIYTRINRDKNNRPSFKNYYYNYDPNLYFNPASMVKMPLAFLALEKLNKLKVKRVNKYTTIQFDSSFTAQKAEVRDSTSANGLPSIAHYIKRAFLISENDPYNRLYQFMGQQAINRQLHNKGYKKAIITRQFMGFTEEQNRHTNAVRFFDNKGNLLYHQPAAYNTDSFKFNSEIKMGKGYLNRSDSLINEPFDFTRHNNIPLEDFQQMLQSVLFPASVAPLQRFDLAQEDRHFLLRYLSQYPSETQYPKYDTSLFYDSYVKFFFTDSSHRMPTHVRVFNKVGWAYGFSTDVSYVVDVKNNVEFMLAATVYVNSDDILNDGKYEYETIGNPFLYQVGQTIYKYELQRNRTHKPQLSNFKIIYDKRDLKDSTPPIKIVDN